jgi:hypothetical protein
VSGGSQEWDEGSPERLYVITGGRSGGSAAAVDLVTLIVSRSAPPPTLQPEPAAILRMCSSPLSVAEISAYLRLPFSATAVLVADLVLAHLAEARAPVVVTTLPDPQLLEKVIHGLSKL